MIDRFSLVLHRVYGFFGKGFLLFLVQVFGLYLPSEEIQGQYVKRHKYGTLTFVTWGLWLFW